MERAIWLRSLVADIGASPEPKRRDVPGFAVINADEAEVLGLLDNDSDDIVCGVFRIVLRLGRRPDLLWRRGKSGEEGLGPRWVDALRRPRAARIVETYLATFATEDDLQLLDEILSVDAFSDVEELRLALAGDSRQMAAAVASRSYQPEWKVMVLTRTLPTADDSVVQVLATGSSTPTHLRSLAAAELHARELLTDTILKALITFESVVDDIFIWAADDASAVTPEQVDRLVSDLRQDAPNYWELQARARAATSTTADLLAHSNSGADALSAWEALSWKQDDSVGWRAREIFDTDAEPLVAPLLGIPVWTDRENLLPFIRARARLAALRVLTRQAPIAEEDLGRVRAEVERGVASTSSLSLSWLAKIATPSDLPMLLAGLAKRYDPAAPRVAEAILRVGGRHCAHELVTLGEGDHAVLAVHHLGQDPVTTDDELQELLYAPDPAVRIAAVEELLHRFDQEQLVDLLETYPQKRTSYYYNVVCELDWHLFSVKMPA